MQINETFVLTIIDRFSTGDIGELELTDGTARLVLRKNQAANSVQPVQASAGRTSGPAAVSADAGMASADVITSPIVGTFYASPSPDAPPFVRSGSKVKAGDTLCILEAMKMMNHLEAEFDCEILSVKAAAGDMVEYGQTLFEVKRA